MAENRSIRQFLEFMRSSGVTHLPTVTLPKTQPKRSLKSLGRPTGASTSGQPTSVKKLIADSAEVPQAFPKTLSILERPCDTLESKAEALNELAEVVATCRRCTELAESRHQTVFGVGNPNARIMFVGEAPEADEDRHGEPFVGAAGQLLNKIIAACDLQREDLYICNILRCRPPGDRNPQPQEAANCREFLDGQIAIVRPEYIVCWGTVAAQNLLNEKRTVGQLRGKFLQHGSAKVLCTYHPSYLLRTPAAKKQVWEDMQQLMADLA